MKRLNIFILCSLLLPSVGEAQVYFGLKGGLNLANWNITSTPPGTSYSYNPAFHAGMLIAASLTKTIVFQPEVQYSIQGTKNKYSYNGAVSETILNSGYINIPILFKCQTNSGFFGGIGPQIGFLINATLKEDGQSMDVKNYFKSTPDVSAVISVGYLSSGNFGLDARFNWGLTNIANDPSTRVYNQVIQAGIFLQFGKRRN